MNPMKKRIMDDFTEYVELARSEGKYMDANLYENVISYANNCHQMTAQETVEYVLSCVKQIAELDMYDAHRVKQVKATVANYRHLI